MFKINDIDDIKAIRCYYEDCLINTFCSSSPDEIENELNKALEVYKTLKYRDKKIVLAFMIEFGISLSETLETFADGRHFTTISDDSFKYLGHKYFKNKYQSKLSIEDMQKLEYYIDFKNLGEDCEINKTLSKYDKYFTRIYN